MTDVMSPRIEIKAIAQAHAFIQAYLLLTEILFFVGPWQWEIPDLTSLLLFLGCIHVAIAVGYLAAKYRIGRQTKCNAVYWHDFSNVTWIKTIILFGLALAIPTSLSRTGSPIPNVLGGLSDLGSAYNENYDRGIDGSPFAVIEYVRIILSPLLVGIVAVTVFFWQSMPSRLQVFAGIAIAFNIAIYIAIGTNKGIADLVILTPIFAYFAKLLNKSDYSILFNRTTLIGLVAFILFLLFFGQTQELREGGVGSQGVFNTGNTLIYADPLALPAWVSNNWVIIYQSITRYLTQGYQALSFSFIVDHPSTFGVGNSMFLTDNAEKIFHTNYFSINNLPAILEARVGWSRFYLWSSAYVWFASDFGYAGTIVLVGVFAFILFLAIVRMLIDPNVVSVILVQQMVILFLYLPANNQIFQNGEGLFGTIGIILISLIKNHTTLPVTDERLYDRATDLSNVTSTERSTVTLGIGNRRF